MKTISTYLLFLLGILFNSCSNPVLDILSKTNKKLQDFTSVQYKYDYKNYNFMTGELGISDSLIAVFDFIGKDSIFGARYNLSSNYGEMGFNGLTSFYTIKEKKQLVFTPVHSKEDLEGIIISIFSIKQLRDLLPQMLNDTAVIFNRMADTIIENTDCIGFDILMYGKSIDMFGNIVQKENTIRNYNLFIDKKDLLPKQFISLFEKNSPIWVMTYNKINPFVTINDSLFDYSLQKSDYKKYTFEEYQLVSMNENILRGNSYVGVKALDWTLPSMTGDSLTLSQIDANLIMLEFWFPYCTGCVLAIPEINEIHQRFKNKGLKVYGIEFTKSDSTGLADYIKKMKMEYPSLYSAKEVASNYGVSAGPSVFLIKDGKFVYARNGFIKNELLNEIEKNLR
ncbi:MAG: TlpA family protein disulfide reductase [Saprospiraceae bacterium]|nr:TlpA family protein disulfide reductase [Saprospiraceae bacterium]